MKKGLILVSLLALVFAPVVFAASSQAINVTVKITQGVSVTVSPLAYAFGETSEGQALATAADAFTATNDGNGLENLSISVANSTDWTASSAAAEDAFAMNLNDGTLIDPASGAALAISLAPTAAKTFGLELLVPTSTTKGGIEQTIPVTVTAQAS